jgi:hypothetical protein
MKELIQHQKEELQVHSTTEQQKKQKYLGSLKLQKGLTCWELNIITGLIKQAHFESEAVNYTTNNKSAIRRKLIIKENCIYEMALNLDNAVRKLKAKLEKLKQLSSL